MRERESAFTSGQVAGVLVGEDSNGRVLEDGLGGRSRLGLEDSEEKVKGENGTKTRRKKNEKNEKNEKNKDEDLIREETKEPKKQPIKAKSSQ